MSDENEAPEPKSVSQSETAQAGESKRSETRSMPEAFTQPNYEEMNANISETRKQAGPELEEEEAPATRSKPEEDSEEDDIGSTDPA